MHASATAVQGTSPTAAYARFRAAVARAHVTHWLAEFREAVPATLVDISGPAATAAWLAADSGHAVLHVIPPEAVRPGTVKLTAEPAEGPCPENQRGPGRQGNPGGHCGRPRLIAGDASSLEFLADGCADGVIAEDRTLSVNLAAETLVGEIARVLVPGGRVLACVDNLTSGMAALAQQSRWPHLVDLPHADVVLVPWPNGTITRCYGAEQLHELFTAGGFDVSWIRPRTVFAPRAVSYLLARDPASFPRLLNAELRARSDDSVGDHLIVSAQRR
ncbi:MAG: methyltransferase [Nocardiopsaceae bacterium]|nr:methyltransferase [Nocardiopsaceae bacterium]